MQDASADGRDLRDALHAEQRRAHGALGEVAQLRGGYDAGLGLETDKEDFAHERSLRHHLDGGSGGQRVLDAHEAFKAEFAK